MKRTIGRFFLAAMAGATAAAAVAAVPQRISYQGFLRESGGLALGNKTMVFRLYASSSATTEFWTSPSLTVTVSTGLFHVTLEPTGVDWEANGAWLELEVNGMGLGRM